MAIQVHAGWNTVRAVTLKSPFPQTAFGVELDRVICDSGLSYCRAGKRIGFSEGYLSRLVSGGRRPTREAVDRIACGLDLCNADRQRLYVLAGFVPFDLASMLIDVIEREA